MEEGSLLQEALEHAKTLHTASVHDSLLANCVLLDLHSLGTYGRDKENHLLYLAELAVICNRFFQSKGHYWHYGADGPVFGIHLDGSESVPHLRAYCRYGPSVQDSWMAIYYVVELIKSLEDGRGKGDVVASFWDVQDGQLVLIQLAELLPPWVDEDSTDNHRYACWIDQDGTLQLLRKPHITLLEALQELAQQNLEPKRASSDPNMQEALMYWLELNAQAASIHQRAPMVLPRKVARVFRERPDLLRTSIQAFCEYVHQDGPIERAPIKFDFTKYEDWVWTVQSISRTNYAMVRTVSSSRGDWTSSPDSVPTSVGVEVKRYRRQCKMEGTKHLKHSVVLGIRAVAGLELLVGTKNKLEGIFTTSVPLSSLQERMVYWNRVQQQYGRLKNSDENRTMLDNFQLGPNKSDLDLTNILKCPVFPEEAQNWTSYSNPQTSLGEQAKNILSSKAIGDNDVKFSVPQPDQVDGEDWMDYEVGKGDNILTVESQEGLDNLLSRFQSFLNQKSGVEGISSSPSIEDRSSSLETDSVPRIEINPRVFLNILHSVLKGDKLEFPTIDPFFYKEDYDFTHDDSDSDDDNDDTANGEGTFKMNELMNAMDKELEARTESRRTPSANLDASEAKKGSIDADAHILHNLLESLDASGGGSGPVINMLKEMETDN